MYKIHIFHSIFSFSLIVNENNTSAILNADGEMRKVLNDDTIALIAVEEPISSNRMNKVSKPMKLIVIRTRANTDDEKRRKQLSPRRLERPYNAYSNFKWQMHFIKILNHGVTKHIND